MGKQKQKEKPGTVTVHKPRASVKAWLNYWPNRREIEHATTNRINYSISKIPPLLASEECYEFPQQRLQYMAHVVKMQECFRKKRREEIITDTIVEHGLVEEFAKVESNAEDPPYISYFAMDAQKAIYDQIIYRLLNHTDKKTLCNFANDIARMDKLIMEIQSMQNDENKD